MKCIRLEVPQQRFVQFLEDVRGSRTQAHAIPLLPGFVASFVRGVDCVRRGVLGAGYGNQLARVFILPAQPPVSEHGSRAAVSAVCTAGA